METQKEKEGAKVFKRYNTFEGSLTIKPIHDPASKFETWSKNVRGAVSDYSKAGPKAYTWILSVEDKKISVDFLRSLGTTGVLWMTSSGPPCCHSLKESSKPLFIDNEKSNASSSRAPLRERTF